MLFVSRQVTDCFLVIAADGWLRPQVLALRMPAAILNRLTRLGAVRTAAVPKTLQAKGLYSQS
jgi:hypothetical protein